MVKVYLVLLMLRCQTGRQIRGSVAGAAGRGRHVALEGVAHAVVALGRRLGPHAPVPRLQLREEGVALYVCINLQRTPHTLQDMSQGARGYISLQKSNGIPTDVVVQEYGLLRSISLHAY